jgi:hypothetical protein
MSKPKVQRDSGQIREASGEEELLDAIDRVLLDQFPNPGRKGCPANGVLKFLASSNDVCRKEPWVNHIMHCSPCAKEYDQHRKNWEWRQRTKRHVSLVAAAVLLIVVLWSVNTAIRSMRLGPLITKTDLRPLQIPEPPTSSAPIPLPPVPSTSTELANLDLRDRAVYRGESRPREPKPLVLDRGPRELAIHLPFGSDDGSYELQILAKNGEALVTATGMAEIKNGVTTLRVKVDTTAITPGTYDLGITRAQGRLKMYPLILK